MSTRQATKAPARRKPAQRRPLKVVRGKRKGRIRRSGARRSAPAVVAVALVVISSVSIVLIEQVMLAQTAFKVAQMREQIVKAEARHAELVLQAAQLGSSERIERVATQDLGMVPPEEVHYIVADIQSRKARVARQGSGGLLPADGHTAALEGDGP